MDVVRGVDALPVPDGPAAVTVGFFDGVHRGHQAVIGETLGHAVNVVGGLRPVAVTFDRHPREIITPGTQPKLLTTLERKAGLIADLGIQTLVVLEFTQKFSEWPAEEFVRRVLVEGLRTAVVVVGANFTFGHRAEGNVATLVEMGRTHGFTAKAMPLLSVEGRRYSSTSIREALEVGDLTWPEHALGRRFVLDGVVVPGAGRGAGLGFPTANLEIPPKMLLPADGVYAGRALTPDGAYVAAINVGTNPTFGREPRHVEAFLLDFPSDRDLRGRPVPLEFWARIRDELRFDSAKALAEQIEKDVERTRELVR
jgi:riboflavin kinase / FMN adenylyltransferase